MRRRENHLVRYTFPSNFRSLTRYSAACRLNFFPNLTGIGDAFERVMVSEDDVARRQIEEDLRLYGTRPEPPDLVEVNAHSQVANLPRKRTASDFEAAVERPAKQRKNSGSKDFNYQTLTAMDWNSGASPLDAWLNQSAVPSTAAASDQQESIKLDFDPLAQEIDGIKVFRNVHIAIAPSPEHNDPSHEPVEGLDFGAQIYYRNINDQFPVIPKYLARRLAQANCDRADRLRREKERVQKEQEAESQEAEEKTPHIFKRVQGPKEHRDKERRRADNIEKLNRQLQTLQVMINQYKLDGFVMLNLNHTNERGFTSRVENPACIEFWNRVKRRILLSPYLKIEDIEQEVRRLEEELQKCHQGNEFSNIPIDATVSSRSQAGNSNFPSKRSSLVQELRPFQYNTFTQQFPQNPEGLALNIDRSQFPIFPTFAIPATTPPRIMEDCTPPPPVDFWTRGSQISRPASVHSRSSSMNSSLHGRPAFDPQEQDPTFASKQPASSDSRIQSYPALPPRYPVLSPPPVELDRVTRFNCDICDQKLEIKRRLEWQ